MPNKVWELLFKGKGYTANSSVQSGGSWVQKDHPRWHCSHTSLQSITSTVIYSLGLLLNWAYPCIVLGKLTFMSKSALLVLIPVWRFSMHLYPSSSVSNLFRFCYLGCGLLFCTVWKLSIYILCIYTYIYIYIYIRIYNLCTYIFIYMCMYAQTIIKKICIWIYIQGHMCVCPYVCVYMYSLYLPY